VWSDRNAIISSEENCFLGLLPASFCSNPNLSFGSVFGGQVSAGQRFDPQICCLPGCLELVRAPGDRDLIASLLFRAEPD